jgi:hypothetical protein
VLIQSFGQRMLQVRICQRGRGTLFDALERGTALPAELLIGGILLLTPGAISCALPTRRARLMSADDSVGAGRVK